MKVISRKTINYKSKGLIFNFIRCNCLTLGSSLGVLIQHLFTWGKEMLLLYHKLHQGLNVAMDKIPISKILSLYEGIFLFSSLSVKVENLE